MDAAHVVVSLVTVIASVGLSYWLTLTREIEHATRGAFVKLQGDVRLLAMQWIANACHTDRSHLGISTKEHAEESVQICRDTRIAIIAVKGDMLGLQMLTGKIDRGVRSAVDILLTQCNQFVPSPKGWVCPPREAYREFDVDSTVDAIEKAITVAWKQQKILRIFSRR